MRVRKRKRASEHEREREGENEYYEQMLKVNEKRTKYDTLLSVVWPPSSAVTMCQVLWRNFSRRPIFTNLLYSRNASGKPSFSPICSNNVAVNMSQLYTSEDLAPLPFSPLSSYYKSTPFAGCLSNCPKPVICEAIINVITIAS